MHSIELVLILIGVNSVFYCLLQLIILRGMRLSDSGKTLGAFCSFLYYAFSILSCPFAIVPELIRTEYQGSRCLRYQHELDKAKYIGSLTQKPSDTAIRLYSFDCDLFTDSFGHFDLEEWKKYEMSKLYRSETIYHA